MKKQRWLVLTVPCVTLALLAQLACGDDGGTGTGTGGLDCKDPYVDEGGDKCVLKCLLENDDGVCVRRATDPDAAAPDATVRDSTVPDSTVQDSTVPDSTVPDSTAQDSTVPDATQADASDAAADAKSDADAGGPICTVQPTFFDGGVGESYFSFDVNATAAAGTCAVKPSTQPDDPNVHLIINFDPGATTFNVYATTLVYEIVSVSAVKGLADGGASAVDAGGTDGYAAHPAFDTTVTLKFRQKPTDAGDAGSSATRTMVFRMNTVGNGAHTLTLLSFN